ncbi:MAG: ATP-binding protein [Myxococcota bacterium]
MGFVDAFRSSFSSSSPWPPQAQVWDCFNRAQALSAAFEVHEVALRSGFMPEEATTLSLTVAELASNAVEHGKGGVTSVFFRDNGWRVEVSDAGPGFAAGVQPALSSLSPDALSSVRVVKKPTGGSLVVAEYERRER